MPRSYDSRQFPAGPFVEPRVTPTHRGLKRLGAIGEIVPGDDIEVARAIARIRHPRQRVPPIVRSIKLSQDGAAADAPVAGDGLFITVCTEDMAGYQLYAVELACTTVSSSGKPTVQLRNMHDDITLSDVDMLVTKIEIDVGEYHSKDAATQYEIDLANNVVEWGDRISVDLDIAGVGTRGLEIHLFFCPA